MTKNILLISSNFNLLEIPWIKYILSNFTIQYSHYGADLLALSKECLPIFVVSDNVASDKLSFKDFSFELYKRQIPFGLIHISDEWFIKTNHAYLYRYSSFVLRNYFSPVFYKSNIFQFPLGISPDLLTSLNLSPKPFDERTNLLHFSGEIKYSRRNMLKVFTKYGYNSFPRFDRYVDYLDHLCNTKYVLCPNGNTTPDTYRLYESLICGCIPITEKTFFVNYLRALFSNKNYPACRLKSYLSWGRASLNILQSNAADAQSYQHNLVKWWTKLNIILPDLCENFINMHRLPVKEPPNDFELFIKQSYYFIANFIWLISMQKMSTLFDRCHIFMLKLLRKYSR